MTNLTVTQNDTGFDLEFTLRDTEGNIIDLTGLTEVKFRMVEIDSGRNVVDRAAAVEGAPTSGVVKYSVNGDFKDVGNFEAGLTLIFGAKVVTTRPIFVSVLRKLGGA